MEEPHASPSIEERYCATAASAYHDLPSLGLGGGVVPLADVHVMLRSTRASLRSHDVEEPDARHGLRSAPLTQRTEPPVPLGEALRNAPRMLLTGKVGAGKTTSLRFIALCFAEGTAQAKLGLDEVRLPVHLSLRDHAQQIADSGLRAAVEADVKARLPEAGDTVDTWWKEGRLVVLLDGLDEVLDPALRNRVISRIVEAELDANRLVVSTRPTVEVGRSLLASYQLCPLDSPEDRIAFLAGWINAFSHEPGSDSSAEATALHEALSQREGLARLVESPLLLRMIAHIYVTNYRHDVSRLEAAVRNRAGIYRRYLCDVLPDYSLKTGRNPEQAVGELLATARCIGYLVQSHQATTRDAITHALQRHRGMSLDDIREHLAALHERLGLLTYGPGSDPEVGFAHLSFQEYLCADWLAQRWCEEPRRTWRFLRPRLHIPAWRETLLLLAGILAGRRMLLGEELKPRQASRLVWRVLWANSDYERLLRRDVVLAAHLLSECPRPVTVRCGTMGWWLRLKLYWATMESRRDLYTYRVRLSVAKTLSCLSGRLPRCLRRQEPEKRSMPPTIISLLTRLHGSSPDLWRSPVTKLALIAVDQTGGLWEQPAALDAVAPLLPEELADKTLETLSEIDDADIIVPALVLFAPTCSKARSALLSVLVEKLVDPYDQAVAYAEIAAVVAPEQRAQCFSAALAAIARIWDDKDKPVAMGVLVKHLPSCLISDLLSTVRSMSDRRAILVALAVMVPHVKSDELDDLAKQHAGMSGGSGTGMVRGELVAELIIDSAISACIQFADPYTRMVSIYTLSPQLSPRHAIELLPTVEEFDESWDIFGGVLSLFDHLPTEFHSRALEAVCKIRDDDALAWTIAILAPYVRDDMLETLAEASSRIVGPAQRAHALSSIAYRERSVARAQEALHIAKQVGDCRDVVPAATLLAEAHLAAARTPDLLAHGWWFRSRAKRRRMSISAIRAGFIFISSLLMWVAAQYALGQKPVLDNLSVALAGLAALLYIVVAALPEVSLDREPDSADPPIQGA